MPKKQNKSPKPKKKNNGRWTSIIIIAVLTMIIGIYLLAKYSEKIPVTIVPQKAKTRTVSLYFSDDKNMKLNIEKRDIKKGAVADEIKEVVAGLIKGPSEKLTPTVPEDAKLLNAAIKQGTAFLDFSPEISSKHPGGSSAEIQTIYSIVNTITSNFPEIKNVQILINGKKEKTLAGHIDISFPIAADKTK
ncbi:MAG: GerMN domain-containing protein [Deltaproteobacteria bacterium]|nr:GerMN domain-containing protein [Deltaproteobacteria bacterium]